MYNDRIDKLNAITDSPDLGKWEQKNIYNAEITFTTLDIGREANSKEECIESIKKNSYIYSSLQ